MFSPHVDLTDVTAEVILTHGSSAVKGCIASHSSRPVRHSLLFRQAFTCKSHATQTPPTYLPERSGIDGENG
jgi:hypothetical protein